MSKIKDLLAEEEKIDDLMKTNEADEQLDWVRVSGIVFGNIKKHLAHIKESMLRDAEWGYSTDEEGHSELCFVNFGYQCDHYASSFLDDYISNESVDISDEDYVSIQKTLKEALMEELEDFEAEAIAEHKD